MIHLLSTALATGGLLSPPGAPQPVLQTAERVAFAIDGGFVEAHVQVSFNGRPDRFAWVVPVPPDVEVFPSNTALFQVLDERLGPRFLVEQRGQAFCGDSAGGCGRGRANQEFRGDKGDPPSFDTGVDSDVIVADAGLVGPYDYVVLTGVDEASVVGFLSDEGYEIGPGMTGALEPYLAAGSHLLVVRLQKTLDAGDIAPIGFRYPGTRASLPIRLTQLAAVDALPLQVDVFGGSRAVSDTFLHVTLDEARIDWRASGENYDELVSHAVDEAGGHAVVTDFAGDTYDLRNTLWSTERESWATILQHTTDPGEFHEALIAMALPQNASVHYGTGGRFTEFRWARLEVADLEDLDLPAFAADLEALWFDDLRRIQAMLDHPYVTRLSTRLDASEMTVDPGFVLNHLAPEVQRNRTLIAELHCKNDELVSEWTLEDGRSYRGPWSGDAPDLDRSEHSALRIERWSASGPPVVLVDHTEDAERAADPAFQRCGCEGIPTLPGGVLALLGSLLLARRRR